MKRKAKGTRNEYKAKEALELLGYKVTRSAASLGAWDLVGISKAGFVVAQVKSNAWPSSEERALLAAFEAPENCRKLIIRFDDYAKEPQVQEV